MQQPLRSAELMDRPWLSIVIPVRNEAGRVEACLAPLQPWRGSGVELIVVDGESADDSVERARPLADRVVKAPAGRAVQMNGGAALARADFLWFLHADTGVTDRHLEYLYHCRHEPCWGRFDVRLSGRGLLLWLTGMGMNLRSRWTGIATGDQGIFVHRTLFAGVGGYPEQPLMEDVELTARLRQRTRPLCPGEPLEVDSRRWEKNGRWRTILLMWWLRFRYWRGEDPGALHRSYYGGHQHD